jgi:hypothetical protein
MIEAGVLPVVLVDVAQGDPAALKELLERRPQGLGRGAEKMAKSGRFLARAAPEHRTDGHVIARRHGVEEIHLLEQQALDALSAAKRVQRLVDLVLAELGHHVLELVADELHPQLGDLVDDLELHLVVAGETPGGFCSPSSSPVRM